MRVLEVPGVGLEVSLGTARSSEEGGHGEKGGREGKGAGGEEVLQPPTCPAGPDRTGCITSFWGEGRRAEDTPLPRRPPPCPLGFCTSPRGSTRGGLDLKSSGASAFCPQFGGHCPGVLE